MTQKAATMAMKIRVVWTMGSGMPIVATAVRLLCGHRGGRLLKRGDAAAGAAAGVGQAQRCRSDAKRASCYRNARGRPGRRNKNQALASVLQDASLQVKSCGA